MDSTDSTLMDISSSQIDGPGIYPGFSGAKPRDQNQETTPLKQDDTHHQAPPTENDAHEYSEAHFEDRIPEQLSQENDQDQAALNGAKGGAAANSFNTPTQVKPTSITSPNPVETTEPSSKVVEPMTNQPLTQAVEENAEMVDEIGIKPSRIRTSEASPKNILLGVANPSTATNLGGNVIGGSPVVGGFFPTPTTINNGVIQPARQPVQTQGKLIISLNMTL